MPTKVFANTLNEKDMHFAQQMDNVPSLIPTELLDAWKETQNGGFQLNLYAQMILKQPEINLNSIKDNTLRTMVVEHQQQNKNNALRWNKEIKPNLLKMNEAMIAYENDFSNQYFNMIQAINQKDSSKLKACMQQLYTKILQYAQENDSLVKDLISLRDQMSNDVQHFTADANTVDIILIGIDASIPNLQRDIEAQMALITEKNKILQAGIGVCFLNIFGGIAMIVTSKNAIAAAQNLILEKTFGISEAKKDAASLRIFQIYNKQILDITSQAILALQRTSDQLHIMGAKYKNFLAQLDKIDITDYSFLKEDIDTAKLTWGQIKENAEINVKSLMQNYGLIKGGKTYYLNEKGELEKGWFGIDSGRGWKNYFIFSETTGAAKTGIIKEEDGKIYGAGSDGIIIWGWGNIDGKQYYFSPEDANMQTGWHLINGKWYYLGKIDDGTGLIEGEMARNTTLTIDGKTYTFDDKGHI
ncbi:HBL/NHE enterotoxin family protein [Bacillus thuringiensis]|nr:HBL/NHE enterotoxin family protein [Bacillus thuringiensis]